MTHTEHTPASPEPSALAPDTSALDPRAARAWTEKMAVSSLDGGLYAVESESGRSYVVDLPERRCTCPDSTYRGERCKHMRRVALEITEGRVPAPGYEAVTCRACGERAFVREGALELCEGCRLPIGTAVRDRERGDLLVVVDVTDERADSVALAGGTVADYGPNTAYPPGDPVVWCIYPFSGRADQSFEDLKRYAFPRSRLSRKAVTDGQRNVVEHSGPHERRDRDPSETVQVTL